MIFTISLTVLESWKSSEKKQRFNITFLVLDPL